MAEKIREKKLTPKQERFVAEYLIDLNATQAAIRAGYGAANAETIGYQLLQKTPVKAAIDAALAKRAEKSEITAERVLSEIAAMATWDPADIMMEIGIDNNPDVRLGDDGKIYGLRGPGDIRRLPERVRRAIVGWGYDRNQNFTVKLADKSKALDQLARHLALYNDKVEVGLTEALAERLERAARGGAK
jgi:phage terminase small subunit